MVQVAYALREDQNSIFLLQDAGRHYDKYCQITVFGRNIIRPEFFRQYMYFAPFTGYNGKYRGGVTDIMMSIEDNSCVPTSNYVAVIDTEVEFRVTPSVIRQLSREHMPAWGVKPYLDYFSDRKSGILLFLRVYKVSKALPSAFLEKGSKGSSQVLKLYDLNGEELIFSTDVLEPVISDNKFSYLKDEILHLLKVENALLALYESTDSGLQSLQERVIADREIQDTKDRWNNRHLQWVDADEDELEDFDMAQLDYESIYQEVLEISPGMKDVIDYVRNIQAARLGEYDYYLKDIHTDSPNKEFAENRLFDMSMRASVKSALYHYKKTGVDIEDTFQEACIGIIMATRKYNDNVMGLFPSYVSMWMRQVMDRNASPYDRNMRIPVHYREHIHQVMQLLFDGCQCDDINEMDNCELYSALMKYAGCNTTQEAYHWISILRPSESIEDILEDPLREEFLKDTDYENRFDEWIDINDRKVIRDAINTLSEREQEILIRRYGFDGYPVTSLEGIGNTIGITRERVRQIEVKALTKVLKYCYQQRFISREQYLSVLTEGNNGKVKLKKIYHRKKEGTSKKGKSMK